MKHYIQALVKTRRLPPEKILFFVIGSILFLVVASGILFYIWKINLVNYISGIPLCPFNALTGKPCPGCGMSRAFLLLGQLKIIEALKMNLFSVPLLLLMIVYFIFGRIPQWLQKKYLAYIFLFAILTLWIIQLFSSNEAPHLSISAVLNISTGK
jgi:hypothetical protein